MTPLERYRHDLNQGKFEADAAQREAAEHLQRAYDALLAQPEPENSGL